MGGDGATRLRSQSRRLARLAATRVVLVGDDEALLEAAAWLEILAGSVEGRVQQAQGLALCARE